MGIREHAKQREDAWIKKNGRHEYIGHDLVQELKEELADGYNYTKANDDTLPAVGKHIIMKHLELLYELVEVYGGR